MYEHNKPPLSDNDPPPAYTVFPSNVQSGSNSFYHQNYIPPPPPPGIPISPSAPIDHYNSAVPNYGSTVLIVDEQVRRPVNSTVIITGDSYICPVCNIGVLQKEFTLLGILLAILLFPFGLIFLFVLRKWRCSICGRSMGY